MSGYLQNLTIRLAQGVERIPESERSQHAKFVISRQQPDGGFPGREGGSDLYYTGFALRILAILGVLEGEVATRSASFLRTQLSGKASIVDFLSLIYGATLLELAAGIDVMNTAAPDWKAKVAESLAALRRPDGGFAKASEGNASSTYHTFLVLLCLEMMEAPIAQPEEIVAFLHSQRAEEGGFREIRVSKRAGTNPTAAAIAALRVLDSVSDDTRNDTIDFLLEMQNEEGGLRANTRIPIADLLSTFTGLLTLTDLGGHTELDLPQLSVFVKSMKLDNGGYLGAAWDSVTDIEYTFYGIGCDALLRELSNVA